MDKAVIEQYEWRKMFQNSVIGRKCSTILCMEDDALEQYEEVNGGRYS